MFFYVQFDSQRCDNSIAALRKRILLFIEFHINIIYITMRKTPIQTPNPQFNTTDTYLKYRKKTFSSNYIQKKQPTEISPSKIKSPKIHRKQVVIEKQKKVYAPSFKLGTQDTPSNSKRIGLNTIRLPLVNNLNSLIENNEYVAEKLIGTGSFSKVFTAKRKSDGLQCVIKVYENAQLSTESRKQNLKNELAALKLPHHLNIIRYIDHFKTASQTGIVMEYFTSDSLTDYMKKNRPLSQEVLKQIVKQLANALIHLHQHGVSHRDIKAQNILIKDMGMKKVALKIIDFGFATNGTEDEVVVAGTPYFMPPELIAKKNYDPIKADVWAVGILLYWLATGYYPQETCPTNSLKNTNPKQPLKKEKKDRFELHFPVDIDPGLEYLLQKILNPDPSQRITLKQLLNDTWVKPKSLQAEIDKLRKSCKVNAFRDIEFV